MKGAIKKRPKTTKSVNPARLKSDDPQPGYQNEDNAPVRYSRGGSEGPDKSPSRKGIPALTILQDSRMAALTTR